ncbi:AbrB/MazE/SpoVT family DNA-binding domain-containing protein [Leptolinea tardivitalis]|uniref:SpoVT-AbrB domain-containing protein n=1 Tax=Leptolinea tardivitalis TaxID=229920 RepID=A0A0P6XN21_9CHLR|nr:AbrB/MazE/SpoVT family DNA-binding domain-containing protein [Leptolinea tardivitalis]KPL73373.1 hypothetical protein ADM99_03955 [Leptolinea tardivitalis]GAP21514.1 ubiquitin fusion-degradation protein [Leptolinea tardivitalis]
MEYRVQMNADGRFVLPSRMRKELKLEPGDEVILRLEDGSVRLIPLPQAVSYARQTVRKYIKEGTSLVDDLIQSRREQAARE